MGEIDEEPDIPAFPLDEGKFFGPKSIQRSIVTVHEGVATVQDLLGAEQSTGIYDKCTYRDVVIFQRDHDLPVTGLVDDSTWGALHTNGG